MTLTNESWGTKRNCPSCSAHFYDLNKLPAICPKCQHEFDPNAVVRARRKPTRRDVGDAKKDAVTSSVLPSKKPVSRKKDTKEDTDGGLGEGGMDDIAEIEDEDDIENLSELEEIEESPINSDDADDESIIDDMDTSGKVLVDDVEEEEANALVGELDEEEESEPVTAKSKTAKKPK